MILRVPKYFNDFKCIADKCTDNCCVGWEVYIDKDTEKLYKALTVDGEAVTKMIGKRGGAHFVSKNGACPFLDSAGLCKIIAAHGEGALCEICREHPRFYNPLGGVTEGGIGASCPVGARLILNGDSTPTERECDGAQIYELTSEEQERLDTVIKLRDEVMLCSDSEDNVRGALRRLIRLGEAMEDAGFCGEFTYDGIKGVLREAKDQQTGCGDGFLLSLTEYLANTEYLYKTPDEINLFRQLYGKVRSGEWREPRDLDRYSEIKRVAAYLVYRYLAPAVFTDEFSEAMKLAVLGAVTVYLLFATGCVSDFESGLVEFSKQIEYNPETMDKLYSDFNSEDFFSSRAFLSFLD